MALTVTARGVSNNKVSATTLDITPGSNFGSGMAVLFLSYDNSGSVGLDPYSSISDSLGNTWTSRQNVAQSSSVGTPNGGIDVRVLTSPQDVGTLTTSDTITVDWGGTSVPAKAWALWQASPSSGNTVQFVTASNARGATTSFTMTTGTISVGNALLCGIAIEDASSGADDTDTTNGSWSTGQASNTTGSTNNTNVGIRSQYKIQTTTSSTQTWNFTVANTDWAAVWIELNEIFNPRSYGFQTNQAVSRAATR